MIHRQPDWESDLARALDLAQSKTFAWWDHDCVTAACRLAGAAMGRDLLAVIREPWNTEHRAQRVLRLLGGVDFLLNMLARMSMLSTVDPARAPTGALVTIRDDADQLCAGCLVADRVAVVQASGFVWLVRGRIEAAWADV